MYYKRKSLKDDVSMKPRIFVSSTFYDLKYIREDLAGFIRVHDFEPILFEDGDIGYTPGKVLDKSCYDAMRNSDMVILIIGGQYGTAATGEKDDGFKEFLSITRKEFQTAVDSNIPIFAFIDANVYAEYGIYELNMEQIENEKNSIMFRTTKNINIFRFIREIKSLNNICITEFGKSSQIKEFLSKQWSDMFKKYLDSLRNDKEQTELLGAMESLKLMMGKMDVMVNNIGKKVIQEDTEYKKVLLSQNKMISQNIGATLCAGLSFEVNNEKSVDENCEIILKNYKISADLVRQLKNNESANDAEIDKTIFDNFLNPCSQEGIYIFRYSQHMFLQNDFSLYLCDEEIFSETMKYLEKYFEQLKRH